MLGSRHLLPLTLATSTTQWCHHAPAAVLTPRVPIPHPADNGSPWYVSGEASPAWTTDTSVVEDYDAWYSDIRSIKVREGPQGQQSVSKCDSARARAHGPTASGIHPRPTLFRQPPLLSPPPSPGR